MDSPPHPKPMSSSVCPLLVMFSRSSSTSSLRFWASPSVPLCAMVPSAERLESQIADEYMSVSESRNVVNRSLEML